MALNGCLLAGHCRRDEGCVVYEYPDMSISIHALVANHPINNFSSTLLLDDANVLSQLVGGRSCDEKCMSWGTNKH